MQRYLIKFSYSGTRFRGLQRQPGEIFNNEAPYRASIQTILEKAILRLLQYKNLTIEPCVQFSSRTDQGVHSFCNLAHVDLELLKNGTAIPPYQLQKTLNVFCDKSDINITVNSVEAVPPTFHARHSSYSRHYLYRIGVTPEAVKYHPVVEWRKCYFIEKPFCLDRATEACKLFDGTKDFASFCHGLNQRPQGYPTVRTLETFHIKPGRPLFDPVYDPLYSGIDFYDFHIKARSFMYKQVRRMVSVVVAVAKGRMNLEEVHQLFDNPGQWNSKASTAPPYGLYLLNVDYKIPQMSSLNELLKTKGQNLRRVTTRVTLPSGRVFHEGDGVAVESEQSCGFVIDNTPDVQVGQVEEGLFVASQDVANDAELIKKNGITHVLNVAGIPSQKLLGLHYRDVYILDLPEEPLSCHFVQCFEFIDEALKIGRVLVHCNAGISRSVSIVIAFLMSRRQKSLCEAMAQVKAARPRAQPNVGFVEQLKMYESNILNNHDVSSSKPNS